MKIKIFNLSDGVHNFNFDEAVKNIELNEPFFGNILVEAELSKAHGQLVLSAKLTAKANFDCDRCNTNFDSTITNTYKMVYLSGMEPEESDSINVTYLPPDADKIVLDDDVRDFALLALPMKRLCNEDCKGLCPRCGKNLNEGDCGCNHETMDDRWLPLMELKNKINNN
ncbi:MAG: DUF177 domain-containing protein [Ignavibacteriaceae bacterium]|nr:DUF177 domain-containing protein [Ignavibacteriaceae bacterium]